MLHVQIDPHSGVPIYRQVMDQVRYYAASGALKPGALLPSIRDLARALSVNPMTIAKAYTELEHEGVVEMKQGKGAFLAEPGAVLPAEGRREALQRSARRLAVEAKQMGAPGDLVLRIVEAEMDRIATAPDNRSRTPDAVKGPGPIIRAESETNPGEKKGPRPLTPS